MSYSRWGNSCWYTYWSSMGETDATKHIKDKQQFDISGMTSFTYRELKDDIDGCIQQVRQLVCDKGDSDARQDMFIPNNVTEDELKELKGYMEEFIKDIDTDEDFIDPLYEDLKEVKKSLTR